MKYLYFLQGGAWQEDLGSLTPDVPPRITVNLRMLPQPESIIIESFFKCGSLTNQRSVEISGKKVEFWASDRKYLNNSKTKGLGTFKLACAPINVMIAVSLMGLLTSKILSEAEIRLLQNRVYAIPDTKL